MTKILGVSADVVIKVGAAVVGTAVLVRVFSALKKSLSAAAFQKSIATFKKDVVHLYMYPRWSKGPSLSGPCLKLEAFLRLAKIPYVVHFTMDASPSPTERMPYMVLNGETIPDSEFCIQRLTKHFNVAIDSNLTPEAHALGLVTRRAVESTVGFGYYRSLMVDNMPVFANVIIAEKMAPALLVNWLLAPQFRKGAIKMLNSVGHGDLTDEQYMSEYVRDFKALETLLSGKKFLLTDDFPTSYDCAVYNALHIQSLMTLPTAACKFLHESSVLQGYVDRMNTIVFPDMATLATTAPTQEFTQPR